MRSKGFFWRMKQRLSQAIIGPYLLESKFAHSNVPYRHFFWNAFSALRTNQISGAYAEFGVYGAGSFSHAYLSSIQTMSARPFWGFDSFLGLPEGRYEVDEHPRWQPGRFAKTEEEFHRSCKLNGIPRAAYEIVPGYYSETLDKMAPDDAPVDIAFAFIDCDMYSSTISVLNFLEPRLKHGMILGFDDYFLYSDRQLSGERRAFLEKFAHHLKWHFEPFLPINWFGTSFIVEDRASHPPER